MTYQEFLARDQALRDDGVADYWQERDKLWSAYQAANPPSTAVRAANAVNIVVGGACLIVVIAVNLYLWHCAFSFIFGE